jgi:C4-dicarboxylate-specific signal transduction histidine kinase
LFTAPAGPTTRLAGSLRTLFEEREDELEAQVTLRTEELAASNTRLEEQVAETHRSLDELERARRAATVREIASDRAHELNQPLTAILANAQAASHLLQEDPPDLEEAMEAVREIISDERQAAAESPLRTHAVAR